MNGNKCLCIVFITIQCCLATPKVLIVSLDGFRHDYFQLAENANISLNAFKEIFSQGIRADKMNNVFTSKTYPNHITLITGLYEESHGIIDNKYFDVKNNETVTFKSVKQMINPNYSYGIEPIWATNMKNGFDSAMIYWPGQLYTYQKKYFPLYHFGCYQQNIPLKYKFDVMLDWMKKKRTTLGLLYHPEPDETGHRFGPNSPQILEKLKELDKDFEYLLNKIKDLRLKGSLNVFIVSDHGMTETSKDRVVKIDELVDPRLYDQLQSSLAFWGLRPKNESAKQSIINALANISHVTTYRREEIPKDWHYGGSANVAPLVLLADLGWSLVHNSSTEIKENATHGYNASESDMKGIFAAWGPQIVTNKTRFTMNSVDVFPLVATILQLKHLPRINGSFDSIKWMIKIRRTDWYSFIIVFILLGAFLALAITVAVLTFIHNRNGQFRQSRSGNESETECIKTN